MSKGKRRHIVTILAILMALIGVLMGMKPVRADDTPAVDASPYVTSISVSRQEDGGWVESSEFNDGDSVSISLGFTFPSGIITSNTSVATYQLPNGITLATAQNGTIYSRGEHQRIGTYQITTDGTITFSFDTGYATQEGTMSADVSLQGIAHMNDDGNDRTISFGGTSITVFGKQTKPDVSIKKSGSLISETQRDDGRWEMLIGYTLTISTRNGTVGRVQVGDTAQGGTNVDRTGGSSQASSLYFVHDSFTHATKIGTDGTRTNIDFADGYPRFGNDDGKPSLSIEGLPPLAAGERYEITYQAKIVESDHDAAETIVNNTGVARVHDQGLRSSTNNRVQVHNDIAKYGTFDKVTGEISWEIWFNRNHDDARNSTITDTLPQEVVGDITVTPYGGSTYVTLNPSDAVDDIVTDTLTGSSYDTSTRSLSIILPDKLPSDTEQYVIRYRTKAPRSGSVTNTAVSTHDGVTRSATATVGIIRDGNTTTSKTAVGSYDRRDDGFYYLTWKANANIPDIDATGTIATLHDDIGSISSNDGFSDETHHYAIASELMSEFDNGIITVGIHGTTTTYTYRDGALVDGNGNMLEGVSLTFTFYDADGNQLDTTNSDTHVRSFDISLVSTGTLNGRFILVNGYHTKVDASDMPRDTLMTVMNAISMNGVRSQASNTIRTPANTISKDARSLDNRGDPSWNVFSSKMWDGWEDGLSLTYDEDNTSNDLNRAVQFRIRLNAYDKKNGDVVTVTDTLPEGMSLERTTTHPVRLVRYNDDTHYWDASSAMSVTTNGQTVTFSFTISDSVPAGQFLITYTANFDHDERWKDVSVINLSYDNVASYDGNEADTTVHVHHNPVTLTKDGEQVQGTDGYERTLQYSVNINPAAQDFNADGDTLTLTDTLTWDARWVTPSLDLTTVRLYEYDAITDDHLGKEMPSSTWSVKYTSSDGDTPQRVMTLTVPDGKRMVLTYEYTLDRGTRGEFADGATIGNSIQMSGYSAEPSSVSLHRESSSVSVSRAVIRLYKTDADNDALFLDGATFTIERLDADGWVTLGDRGSVTLSSSDTDGHAYHLFDCEGTDATDINQHDTLYRITEDTAPDGYVISMTPMYVCWLGDGENADTAFTNISANQQVSTDGITQPDILFMSYSDGGNAYFSDKSTSITVEKSWVNQDGSILDDDEVGLPSSISVRLYQQECDEDGNAMSDWTQYTDGSDDGTYAITKADGWKRTFTDLPVPSDVTHTYRWKVIESDLTSWQASYMSDDGITAGIIGITNRRTYWMPETGGNGTQLLFVVLGTLTALCTLKLIHRNDRNR